MRLLLIEDDPMIGESLEEGLRKEKYQVDWARDGLEAQALIGKNSYHLVLLDLGLPKKQGLDILESYRKEKGKAAVLIITARDSTFDRIKGLDAGADDYLVKPFDLDELFARLRALLRRSLVPENREIDHLGLTLNVSTHEAAYQGKPLHLSVREFKLMLALLDEPGRVMSKAKLEEKLYGWEEEIESNTIEVYIHALRKKLGQDFIKNVRGVGYKVANKS
ncbi:response regulator transcription factor [Undibacterium sp.]|jgi:two-component system response regulator QseB|uniref:response regulator transcription factor n=1 Tax=Undibacterium sp. TaxID=1914977 RepID=UPI002B975EB9|nr:response regulator transcription factor [Undibacterium sp.]HTD04604.1 response regulator transcription factor [Undibacterium sp.]